jgi:hypothetical protein
MSRVLTHLFVVVFAVACIAIASAIAWSHLVGSPGAPAYVTKADFDQAFADVAQGRRESKPTIRDVVDGSARSFGGTTANVNRDRKSDRLPVAGGSDASAPASTSNTTLIPKNAASPEPANDPSPRQKASDDNDAMPTAKRLRHCEPVASPFADPVLGRIIGRCFV